MVFAIIKSNGDKSLRGNTCTIVDIVFCNRHGREISFFHHATANASAPRVAHFPSNFRRVLGNS